MTMPYWAYFLFFDQRSRSPKILLPSRIATKVDIHAPQTVISISFRVAPAIQISFGSVSKDRAVEGTVT